jgi:glucosamine--fructose-6-phosphate aminotransferase (isomerizing)
MHFALDEQIASQPQAVRNLLERLEVPALNLQRPLIFTGIGTSLHACRIAAAWVTILTAGGVRPVAINAHSLALNTLLRATDQVVVVSHRGTKHFPQAALDRARHMGATTVAIVGEGAPEPEAGTVIRTCPEERSGTFTVSYITALVVLGHLAAHCVGSRGEALLSALATVPEAIEQTLALPAPVAQAERIAGREPLLITGFDLDAVTAAEAALKLKEGTYRWAEGMEVEMALHGPPAAFRAGMGAITITPASDDGGRTQALRTLLQDLGVEALTCGDQDEDLRFAPVSQLVRPLVAIVPLQRLTAEYACISGTNPDDVHRDVEPWKTAMGRVVL